MNFKILIFLIANFFCAALCGQTITFEEKIAPLPSPQLKNNLSGAGGGYSIFTDVDGDSDLDIIIGSGTGVIEVHLNDGIGNYSLQDSSGTPAISGGQFKAVDVDNDSDMDLLIIGRKNGNGNNFTGLYLNNGVGVFQRDTSQIFMNLKNGTVDFADFNNDGNIDLLLTGEDTIVGHYSEIFLNDSVGNFTIHPTSGLVPISRGYVSTGDIDNDGDIDVFLSGGTVSFNFETTLYLNNGMGDFTASALVFPYRSAINHMVDLDNDADLDLLIMGSSSMSSNTRLCDIYLNDSLGNFTVSSTNIQPIYDGVVAIEDVDGDADLDLFVSGTTSPSRYNTTLYLNSGNATFAVDSTNLDFYQTYESHAIFGDVNSDGQSDLLHMGEISFADITEVFINDSALFRRVGETIFDYMGGELKIGDINGDMFNDIVTNGRNILSRDRFKVYNSLGNDNFLEDSTFSITPGFLTNFSFSDVDNDNDLDIFKAGFIPLVGDRSELYLNNGSGNFTLRNTPFVNLRDVVSKWGDIDNDGDDDLIYTGTLSTGSGGQRVYIYKNNGSGNFTNFTTSALIGVKDGDLTLVDLDSDGDLDIVQTGYRDGGSFNTRFSISKTFFNDGTGIFTFGADLAITVNESNHDAADVDGDGDMDLVVLGQLSNGGLGSARFTTLYLNDGLGNLIEDSTQNFTRLSYGIVRFADLNKNGFPDLYIGGANINNEVVGQLFQNNGDGTFTELLNTIDAVRTDLQFADMNNDDVLDVVLVGVNSRNQNVSKYYINTTCVNTFSADTIETCDSLVWSQTGLIYTMSGLYSDTISNACGSDSIIILDLTILQSSSFQQSVTSCDSFVWSGNTYFNSGTYFDTISNAVGCDSTIVLQLNIIRSTADSISLIACDSLLWMGRTLNQSGMYVDTITNFVGCDSIVTLNLIINNSSDSILNAAACNQYTWLYNNISYIQSGVYVDTLINNAGCDSLMILDLTINRSTLDTMSVAACDSFFWNVTNINYSLSGFYADTIQTVAGCDSIRVLGLQILQPTDTTIALTSCDNYTWSVNQQTYSNSGTFVDTIANSVGCDSIITLNLTINNSSDSILVAAACDQFTWTYNSATYTQSGTYTDTLINSIGCDSLMILNLTINRSTLDTISVAACDSFFWNVTNTNYSFTGFYVDTIQTVAGCDSIRVLDLQILQPTDTTIALTSCDNYTWPINQQTYSNSGTFMDTIANTVGCDSIITLNLTINNSSDSILVAAACNQYTWTYNSATYTQSGSYTDTLINSFGCDSIMILDVTITTLDSSVTNVGDSLYSNELSASYQWLDCNNGLTPINGAVNKGFKPLQSGNFAVEVMNGNCIDTSACEVVILTSLGEVSQQKFRIYPLITGDNFTIETDLNATQQELVIYDINGKLVKSVYINNSKQVVNISGLSNGMYLIRYNYSITKMVIQ